MRTVLQHLFLFSFILLIQGQYYRNYGRLNQMNKDNSNCRCVCDVLHSPSESSPLSPTSCQGQIVSNASATCLGGFSNQGCLDCFSVDNFFRQYLEDNTTRIYRHCFRVNPSLAPNDNTRHCYTNQAQSIIKFCSTC